MLCCSSFGMHISCYSFASTYFSWLFKVNLKNSFFLNLKELCQNKNFINICHILFYYFFGLAQQLPQPTKISLSLAFIFIRKAIKVKSEEEWKEFLLRFQESTQEKKLKSAPKKIFFMFPSFSHAMHFACLDLEWCWGGAYSLVERFPFYFINFKLTRNKMRATSGFRIFCDSPNEMILKFLFSNMNLIFAWKNAKYLSHAPLVWPIIPVKTLMAHKK